MRKRGRRSGRHGGLGKPKAPSMGLGIGGAPPCTILLHLLFASPSTTETSRAQRRVASSLTLSVSVQTKSRDVNQGRRDEQEEKDTQMFWSATRVIKEAPLEAANLSKALRCKGQAIEMYAGHEMGPILGRDEEVQGHPANEKEWAQSRNNRKGRRRTSIW